jgi:hypothetical protein
MVQRRNKSVIRVTSQRDLNPNRFCTGRPTGVAGTLQWFYIALRNAEERRNRPEPIIRLRRLPPIGQTPLDKEGTVGIPTVVSEGSLTPLFPQAAHWRH